MKAKLAYYRFRCSACQKTVRAKNRVPYEITEAFPHPFVHQTCSADPKGKLQQIETIHRIVVTAEEAHDHGNGACLACGAEVASGIEPDARQYDCEACGAARVYGIEELAIMGMLDIVEGESEE
jgi:DNA-directed RNA polymerase subunit RPC12/RpoP